MNQMFREMKAKVEAAWDLRQLIARCGGEQTEKGAVWVLLGWRAWVYLLL